MTVVTCEVCLFQWVEKPEPEPCYRCKCERLTEELAEVKEKLADERNLLWL